MEKDLSKYEIHTDLILESIKKNQVNNIIQEDFNEGNININRITLNKNNKILNKKKGRYITISFEDITDISNKEQVENVFIKELNHLLNLNNIKENDKCLVIGLGNKNSTPDALGSLVIENILVTRHMFLIPEIDVDKAYRNVSCFTPNVMGNTGIEASDIVLGVISKIKPDFVIIVDSLAASSIDRVNKTIQLTDSGISPGSGVGNHRKELSFKTLKIPVIAIGIPTVVDSVVIVSDTINYLIKKIAYSKKNFDNHLNKFKPKINYLQEEVDLTPIEKEQLLGYIGNLNEQEKKELIFEVLSPIGYNMMVTPKEIDFVMVKLSDILSSGINKCLHKGGI